MQFRRSGQRDERRRRVLMEETLASSEDEATGASGSRAARSASTTAPASGKRYSDAARPERQPRVTDLAPLRGWTLWVILLSLLSAVAALVGFDAHVGDWSRVVGRTNLSALDFTQPGSLASWFGSTLLATAAAYCVLVFLIRRHKVDDYRGRYRFWSWAALVLLIGGIDATTGVHRALGGLIARQSGLLVSGDGAVWSLILGGVLFGTLVLRGMFEIRHSRGALAALLLAVAAFGVSIAAWAELLPLYDALARLTGHVALLLGEVLTLFCVLVYSRFVLLDAQGKLRQRERRPKKKRAAAPADDKSNAEGRGRKKLRIDASHQSDQAPEKPEKSKDRAANDSRREAAETKRNEANDSSANSRQPLTRPAVDDDEEEDIDDSPNSSSKMSKAERRRLRKLQRRAGRT